MTLRFAFVLVVMGMLASGVISSLTRPAVVSNVQSSGTVLYGDVTLHITNLTGVYSPSVIYDVNGIRYRSLSSSYLNITGISAVVGSYELQSNLYTVPGISVSSSTNLSDDCVFASWEVSGSNVSSPMIATQCCIAVDTADNGLAGLDTMWGVSFHPTSVTYRVWRKLGNHRDDIQLTGNFQVAGATGSFTSLSMTTCAAAPFIDCMHNASTAYPALLPTQLFQNGTSGQTYVSAPYTDGKYLRDGDWVDYYSTSYASSRPLRQRVEEELCGNTTIYCNATTCTFSYGLTIPIQTGSRNLSDIVAGASLDNVTGHVRLAHNSDYLIAVTYRDTLVRLEPSVTWVSAKVECADKSTTLSYVNHGESGELVVAYYYASGSAAAGSILVVSGIGTATVDSDALVKVCTTSSNCVKVTDRCLAGAADPGVSTEAASSVLFDSKDTTQLGFVISTFVLGGLITLAIGIWVTKKVVMWRMSKRRVNGKGFQPLKAANPPKPDKALSNQESIQMKKLMAKAGYSTSNV